MTRLTKACVAGFIVGVVVFGAVCIISAWSNRDGRCVRQKPNELIRRSIGYGGPFNDRVYYHLGYAGTYEHSGGECVYWRRATEGEYERRALDGAD